MNRGGERFPSRARNVLRNVGALGKQCLHRIRILGRRRNHYRANDLSLSSRNHTSSASAAFGQCDDPLADHVDVLPEVDPSVGFSPVDSSHAKPSLISTIPPELLGEIFLSLLYIDNFVFNFPYISPHTRRAPMLLTYVCSHWREVALGMPNLWSSITTHVLRYKQYGHLLFDLWLQRSGQAPLTLELLPFVDNHDPYALEEIYIYAINQAFRWKFISVEGGEDVFGTFFSLPETGAPLLEGLVLKCNIVPRSNASIIEIAKLRSIFPNLLQLSFHVIPACDQALESDGSILLEQITHFKAHYTFSLTQIGRFTRIIELSLSIITNNNLTEGLPPITLPTLLSATLTISSAARYASFLSNFHCPNLRRLNITNNVWTRDRSMGMDNNFHAFLRRSPHLEQIRHHNSFNDKDMAVKLLQMLQTTRVAEVEILFRHARPAISDLNPAYDEFRCVENCKIIHFGWTGREDGLIGINLPKSWTCAFWDSGNDNNPHNRPGLRSGSMF